MSLDKLITISSTDKDIHLSESNSDFTVVLRERNGTQGIKRIMIKECTVPNVFPNIRSETYGSSQNNLLIIEDNLLTQFNIVLPEGQYVINSADPVVDFATNLKTVIDVAIAGDSVTIVFNELTNKLEFTFTNPSTNTYKILDASNIGSSMARPIGISVTSPTYGTVINSDSMPYLNGYQNVYIHSRDLADLNGIDASFGLISLTEPVSLSNTRYGSYAYKQNNDHELAMILYEQPRNLSTVRIVLRDEAGNKLPIGVHDMNIVFKAFLDSN